ncbi:hypothetical protein EIP86_003199 [Pleurotus ostreatoroseus]|nr:hypothetical protein EIP86_003199 [Pleurotus ostreatoroseus]
MPAKPPSYSNPDPSAVAIVGLSISAPGGEARGLDTEAFYEFLQRRGSGIVTVPKDRWNADAFYGKGPGKICTTKGAFIPEFAAGDPQEFGITPAEAAQLAVTQVASLHQAFNALQRSGVDYRGTNTGVFVGCGQSGTSGGEDMTNIFRFAAGGGPPMEMDITQAGAYYMTGSSLSITANRISYVFDLLGQSLPVDTACSSSLTAMHLAVQAIRRGEIDQAVVAGVNVILTPLETASFSQLGVMSPDGISKSFDDEANGYARGDVASAVVIKRHDLAVKDYDHIYATLVGSALTSCGSIMGSLTTPSPEAQTAAIRNAYHDAGLEPHQADFVELHGAGTVVGDALEAYAAGALFSQNRDGREILMGSVKSNVGHGEMGAYMSSLIKVVMMLDRKQVLPNGHFSKPSTRIEFEKYNLRVPTSVEEFVPHDPELGLIASISSYGFGGALTPKSVHTLIERYKEDYATSDPLALCEHLASRARQMPWRTFAVGHSLQNASFPDPVMVGKRPYPVVLCFSGQGPQHWDQGRNLMRTYSVFRESIEACDAVHEAYTGRSCLKETGLFVVDAPKESALKGSMSWPADIISVAITFFQIAMFDLLISLGLKPDAVVGHSIGETAVLYASGAMSRDMVVKIAIARGRALSKVDNTGGTMVAISGCDESNIRDHIAAVSFLGTQTGMPVADLHLAAFNSPTDIGVSGPEAQVDLLRTYIETWVDGVAARKLRVSTAVHSPFVEPCQETYRAELKTIFDHYESAGAGPFVPKVPTMSTVTADFRDGKEYTIDYLWQNLRQPVLFCRAIENLVEKYGQYTAFVEISPHPVLSQSIKKMGVLDSLPTSSRPPSARQLKAGARLISEHETLLRALGQLVLYGINSINFSVLNGCPAEYIEGPPYPFQWKVTPFALPVPSYLNRLLPRTRPLNSRRLRVSPQLPETWISHHVIDHSNLIPAATYIEMALEFPGVTQLWDCHFEAACILEESVPAVTLEVSKDGISWWVKSSTALQSVEGDLEWTRTGAVFDKTHAYGKVGYGKPQLDSSSITRVDVEAVLARCLQTNYKEEMYADMEGFAQFGDEFKRLNKACMNETEAICWIRGHVEGVNKTDYQFHPALMDAVFQTFVIMEADFIAQLYDKINVGDKDRSFLLPHSLRRAYRNDGSYEPLVLPEEFITYTILQECSPRHWIIDAYVLDDTGAVLFTFEGLYFKLVDQNEQWPQQRYSMYWQPRALPQTQLEGHKTLEGPSTDTIELMKLLDQLALAYTHDTIRYKTRIHNESTMPHL